MLAIDLFREVRPEFLRLAGAPGAKIYLDAVDALENEAALRSGALEREEVLAIIERVVGHHAEIELENTAETGLRERSRLVLDRLLAAGWLAADDRANYRKFIVVDPNTSHFLEALRKIARPGATVFSDKIADTCNSLRNTEALRSEPWQTVDQCFEKIRLGVQELKGVAKSVERHTRQQLNAQSLRENLAVVFDQYTGQVGHGAYSKLIRSRLPTRLSEAREAIARLENDADILGKMADEVLQRQGGDASTAMARAQNRLHELGQALERVVPAADEVDRHTAAFTRKSLARFRYLQEVTGENRATVQQFFETINTRCASRRVLDLEDEILEWPALFLTEVQLLAGLDSLRFPTLRHAAGEVEALDDEISDEVLDRSRRQLTATLRDSLTVARANRFALEAFDRLGTRVDSQELLHTEDDLADLVACLLHTGAREARFKVEIGRDVDDVAGDVREMVLVLAKTRRLEHFTLVKK